MVMIKFNPEITKLLNCSFSLKENILASCSSNGRLILFDTNLNQKIPLIYKLHQAKIHRSFFFKKTFLTASLDKTCSLWNIDKMEKIRILNMFSSGGIDIDMLDNKILTLEMGGNFTLWDQRIRTPVTLFHNGIPSKNCRFFGNSEKILSSGAFSEFYFWDLRYKKKPFLFFSLKETRKEISSFCISQKFLFCLSKDGQVSRWSLNFNKSSVKFKSINPSNFKINKGRCDSISISTDLLGEFFGYGNSSGESFIRSQKTCKLLKKFTFHEGDVNCVAFNKNNRLLASCGNDGFLAVNYMK